MGHILRPPKSAASAPRIAGPAEVVFFQECEHQHLLQTLACPMIPDHVFFSALAVYDPLLKQEGRGRWGWGRGGGGARERRGDRQNNYWVRHRETKTRG